MSMRTLIMLCMLITMYDVHANDKQQEAAGFAIGTTVFGGSTVAFIVAQHYFAMTSDFQMSEAAGSEVIDWLVPGTTKAMASAGVQGAGSGESTTAAAGSETLLDTLGALAPEVVVAGAVVVAVVAIALATMPFWLPPILKQSGVANSTLYEVKSSIDFQGAVGSSCSRAHLVMYPYSRKDLGAPWRIVGGDRGRACIPERYGASLFIAMRGSVVHLASSIKDQAKHMKNIMLSADKKLRIQWANA